MALFKGKYRVETSRAPFHDYGSNGTYFVTICTYDREQFFGRVKNNLMVLSEAGNIALSCWKAIPGHYPFVVLSSYVVMPNHVHGLITINKTGDTTVAKEKGQQTNTTGILLLENSDSTFQSARGNLNKFGPQSQNLAAIIRGYKAGVTKIVRQVIPHFRWQSRYHDHIVRNEAELNSIVHYIINNPKNWKEDRYFGQ